jgi:hypothetical protein
MAAARGVSVQLSLPGRLPCTSFSTGARWQIHSTVSTTCVNDVPRDTQDQDGGSLENVTAGSRDVGRRLASPRLGQAARAQNQRTIRTQFCPSTVFPSDSR